MGRLADVCPCGFAHVLRRCMAMEGEVDPALLNHNLLKWLQGMARREYVVHTHTPPGRGTLLSV